MEMVANIRQARPEESDLLTALTIRSKAHWGYNEAFMANARESLEFRAGKFLPDFHVYILEAEGKPVGFCSLISVDKEIIELHDLFVEPRQMGRGYGKQLWGYALRLARGLGFKKIVLTADPNAEPFYTRQGAVRVGETASPVSSDRRLPVMEFVLSR